MIAVPVGTVKARPTGERVIWEGETEEQYIRVVEEDDGDARARAERGRRPSTPSTGPGSYLTGNYWDGYLVAARSPAATEAPERIAILGNAAGTTARAYGHYFPGDRDRRGRDRRRADRGRASATSTSTDPNLDGPPRGRPALAARARTAATT